jgi:hypothetical protein
MDKELANLMAANTKQLIAMQAQSSLDKAEFYEFMKNLELVGTQV